MKKGIIFTLVLCMILCLCACGTAETPANPETPAENPAQTTGTETPAASEKPLELVIITQSWDNIFFVQMRDAALAYAEKLAAKPPIAVQMCKKCINIATDAGTSVGLLAEEIQGIYTVSTKDKAEAAAAMLEKRPGRYTCE